MSITVQNIIDWSKPKKGGGRYTVIKTPKIQISIVGGKTGLYGDFIEDFEVAILSLDNKKFLTRVFYPVHDDVIAYMKRDEIETFVNELTTRGFQVL